MTMTIDRPNPVFRNLRPVIRALFRLSSRVDVAGLHHYPATGPYILAINHLHLLDIPVIFTTMRHQTAGIAAEVWARHPFVGPFLRSVTRVIPVNPERIDHRAIAESIAWIGAGGVLLVAPEGQRSPTGSLVKGQPGLALLASRTGVPVLPVVAWGQERLPADLRSLRRGRVAVRVGPPVVFPGAPVRARGADLDAFTEAVMRTLAGMLPPEYRGAYAGMAGQGNAGAGVIVAGALDLAGASDPADDVIVATDAIS